MYIHILIYMYLYMYSYIYRYIHMNVHALAHEFTCTRTCKYSFTRTCTHTCKHTYTHTDTDICTCTCTHEYIHALIPACHIYISNHLHSSLIQERFFPGNVSSETVAADLQVRAAGRLLAPNDARLYALGIVSQQLVHMEVDGPTGGSPPVSASCDEAPSEARANAGTSTSGSAKASGGTISQELEAISARAAADLQHLVAKVDGMAAALEERARAQVVRLQVAHEDTLQRLLRVEQAVSCCTLAGNQQKAQVTDTSTMIKALTAKFHALDTGLAAAAQPSNAPSPDIMVSRLVNLEQQLAVLLSAAKADPGSPAPCSCGTLVEEALVRIHALESKGLAQRVDGDDAVQSTSAEMREAVVDGGLGVQGTLAKLESSIKTLESVVKLQAKRCDQLMKENRQRAVAQGRAAIYIYIYIYTYINTYM